MSTARRTTTSCSQTVEDGPTVFWRTMLRTFSIPGEPAVVALRCLMAAVCPGWSLLQPLEKDLSTAERTPSEPRPGMSQHESQHKSQHEARDTATCHQPFPLCFFCFCSLSLSNGSSFRSTEYRFLDKT